MFTPQQLEQVSFGKAVFGGYDMQSVDDFLEPLLEDYETLYRENSTLKSKMRMLVERLEEYRKNEGSVQDALRSAQKTCDAMVREAEAKCLNMLHAAENNAAAAAPEGETEQPELPDTSEIAALRTEARADVEALEGQLRELLGQLEVTKQRLSGTSPRRETSREDNEEEVAKEIAQNMEKIVGDTLDRPDPSLEKTMRIPSLSGRFSNLQFGKNYDPMPKK